ncbi:hypothetical protein N8500_01485 [Candidatus Puniceispirillum sp.]|nr:hypothetical protein [Candidatus Puniceispirillum sp.]
MKICRNSAYISHQMLSSVLNIVGSSLSNDRLGVIRKVVVRLNLFVFLTLLLLVILMTASNAQQNAPVNLLAVSPVDIKVGRSDPKEPSEIDQAVDQIIKSDEVNSNFKNEPGSNLNVIQGFKTTGEINDLNLGPLREIENSEVDASISNEAVESLTIDDEITSKSVRVRGVYGSSKIGRRKISDVGLAAIGVGETGNSQLDSLIWRGTSARNAIFLLGKAAISGESQVIKQLAYEVVARQTVPPSGANDVAADLVKVRLEFLANGGRSSDLAALASQLPEAKKWANWRRWLVEHYLMTRNDNAACNIVSKKITQTMEPFWHKSNVICQAVKGNVSGARFAADIMLANGVNDGLFFDLVDEVLDGKPSKDADISKLDSAHIVLMDVANRPIPIEGLSVLPKQMAETVMKLKFLEPDARMVSTFEGLKRGLISHRQAGKLWRNAGLESDDPKTALTRLQNDADALTTASTWRALDADKGPDRLAFVAKAVKAEIAAGNGPMMLPLYGELIRNALGDESVASAMQFDDLDIAPDLAYVLAICRPNDTATLKAFGGNGRALLVAKLLQGISRGSIEPTVIGALGMWHMLSIFEAAGVDYGAANWLDLAKSGTMSKRTAVSLSPVLLMAVTTAAENNRIAETVLLSNWLLSDVTLDKTNPADLSVIISSLVQVGQPEAAKGLALEIVKAELMQRLTDMVFDAAQS